MSDEIDLLLQYGEFDLRLELQTTDAIDLLLQYGDLDLTLDTQNS